MAGTGHGTVAVFWFYFVFWFANGGLSLSLSRRAVCLFILLVRLGVCICKYIVFAFCEEIQMKTGTILLFTEKRIYFC